MALPPVMAFLDLDATIIVAQQYRNNLHFLRIFSNLNGDFCSDTSLAPTGCPALPSPLPSLPWAPLRLGEGQGRCRHHAASCRCRASPVWALTAQPEVERPRGRPPDGRVPTTPRVSASLPRWCNEEAASSATPRPQHCRRHRERLIRGHRHLPGQPPADECARCWRHGLRARPNRASRRHCSPSTIVGDPDGGLRVHL